MQKIKKRVLRQELRRFNRTGLLVGAAILSVVKIFLWFMVGVPFGIFHYLRSMLPLLPRWIYMLFDLGVHAILGATIGMVLCDKRYFCETQKYRGAFYFVLAIVFGYLHYVFFFGIGYFLVCVVLALLELICLTIAMLNFFHVTKLSSLFSFFGLLWGIYRFFLSLFSFFIV